MFEKEAEEYVKQNYCEMCVMADDCKSGCIDCFTVQAYIASAEPREKRIAELKKEIEELKKTYRKQRNKRIDDLQKENAELDCQKNRNKFCYSCANATERCFRNEIGCPCEKYKSYKDENAELKKQLEMSNKVYNDNLDYSHHIEEQLTNAKEIICEYVRLANLEKEDTIAIWQLYHKAEQFISEVEK